MRVDGAGAETRGSGVGDPGRLREKSGMSGLPFFFTVASRSEIVVVESEMPNVDDHSSMQRHASREKGGAARSELYIPFFQ